MLISNSFDEFMVWARGSQPGCHKRSQNESKRFLFFRQIFASFWIMTSLNHHLEFSLVLLQQITVRPPSGSVFTVCFTISFVKKSSRPVETSSGDISPREATLQQLNWILLWFPTHVCRVVTPLKLFMTTKPWLMRRKSEFPAMCETREWRVKKHLRTSLLWHSGALR